MNGLFMVCSIDIMVSAYIILMQPIWNNANDTFFKTKVYSVCGFQGH